MEEDHLPFLAAWFVGFDLTHHFGFLAQATQIWPSHMQLRAKDQTLSSMSRLALWNPKSTDNMEPSWGWLCSWKVARPRALHCWMIFLQLKVRSAEQPLWSSSLTTAAQVINGITSKRALPYCWATSLEQTHWLQGERGKGRDRGREKLNNIFRWQDKITNCNLNLKKRVTHSLSAMNLIKLNLHRIIDADGDYANAVLNKCLTVYIYISFSEVDMITLKSLLVQRRNLWIDNPSLLRTHRHGQVTAAVVGEKGWAHLCYFYQHTHYMWYFDTSLLLLINGLEKKCCLS